MIRASVVVAMMALSCVQPAQADHIVVLRAPFYGCENKSDIVAIARLALEAPRGVRAEAVRVYGKAHCLALSRIATTVAARDGDYVCLRRPGRPCLWTLDALIRPTLIDNGVF